MYAKRRKIKGNLRNSLLTSGTSAKAVYDIITNNPDCTSELVEAKGFNNQDITPLKDAGLVVVTGKRGRFSTYRVAKGNEVGFGRDPINVDLLIFENDKGEFGIVARLLDESPTATKHNPRMVFSKRVNIKVPRVDESEREVYQGDLQLFASKPELTTGIEINESVIVDADFEVIPED